MNTSTENTNQQVFISYALDTQDAKWVNLVLIPALGLPREQILTWDDAREGAYKVDEIERLIPNSRFVILVLSPAYFKDSWARMESILAISEETEQGNHKIIPLQLFACDLPSNIRARKILDCQNPQQQPQVIERLRAILQSPEPEPRSFSNPYKGLMSFGENDAWLFFGREKEILNIIDKIERLPLALLIGISGCGKSSLVMAGVIPKMKQDAPGEWEFRIMRPGEHPMKELVKCLEGIVDFEKQTSGSETQVERYPRRCLVVVDQFEEIFTLASKNERNLFLETLKRLPSDSAAPCKILGTMRADFYPELISSKLSQMDPAQKIDILPMARGQLRKAIEEPARRAQVYLDSALVEKLLADCEDEPGALPLLQVVLSELWKHQFGKDKVLSQLTLADYYERYSATPENNENALSHAISLQADGLFTRFTEENRGETRQAIATRILVRLVKFDRERSDVYFRQRQPIERLRSVNDPPGMFEEVIERMARERLIILGGREGLEGYVDLAHDTLIVYWKRLGNLIRDARPDLLLKIKLSEDAVEWEKQAHKREYLYNAQRLKAISKAQKKQLYDPNPLEIEFLQHSRRRALRETGIRWTAIVIVTLLVVVAGILAITGPFQERVNWRYVETLGDRFIADIQMIDETLYVGLYDNRYTEKEIPCIESSSDWGRTWQVLFECKNGINWISTDILKPQAIYVSVIRDGIYESVDAGKNWNKLEQIPESFDISILIRAPNGDLYGAQSYADNMRGLRVSRDQGKIWEILDGTQEWKVTSLLWLPSNTGMEGILAGTTTGLYYLAPRDSGNKLQHWLTSSEQIFSLLLDGASVYAGGSGGIWRISVPADGPRQEIQITNQSVIQIVPVLGVEKQFAAVTNTKGILLWNKQDNQPTLLPPDSQFSIRNLQATSVLASLQNVSEPYFMGTTSGLFAGQPARQNEIKATATTIH